ncbi:MAG: hypothetical protein R3321_05000 [Nitrososphaeraceae archaeon]|nr:hypothetical protein [Nitrososphaeraceae archaeon]
MQYNDTIFSLYINIHLPFHSQFRQRMKNPIKVDSGVIILSFLFLFFSYSNIHAQEEEDE